MTSRLADKSSRVIVVDPSGPVRQMLSDTVRNTLGFERVEGMPSIADCISSLETEQAGWIVAPLMADQPVNGLHLLKVIAEHGELRDVRVTLCLEAEEQYVLPTAFELGLLSYVKKPVTKDAFTEELKQLQACLEANGHSEPRVAGHYLRGYLRTQRQFQAMVDLSRGLLDLYPGHAPALLDLAEAQQLLGQIDKVKTSLAQVKLLDQSLADKADDLAKQWCGGPLTDVSLEKGAGGINILGVQTAVVIDSDGTTSKGVVDLLKSLGVAEVQAFSNGEEAWDHMADHPEPGLIIMEWRVPKLTGPMLIQRARHHGFLTAPIIVLSSLLKPADMPLVRELGVATIIQKPLNRDLFVPALLHTMQQERLPTEQQALERKIRGLLRAGKKADAEPLKAEFLANPHMSMARKRLIEAEFAYAEGQYALARDSAFDALKQAGDGILVTSLLGKTFMRLGDHASALKCFQKAQTMSPQNIERICLMAETQTELGQHDAAAESLESAKNLDAEAPQVAEGEVKVAIVKGDTAAAKELMAGFESLDSIIASMNNKAVALAKSGKMGDAAEVYQKTLDSVPDSHKDPKAIVLYNFALAKIRDGELEFALARLDETVALEGSRVEKKAASLRDRLKKAIEKGTDLKLKSTDMAEEKTEAAQAAKLSSAEDHRRLLSSVEARRGDVCCYLLFRPEGTPDARITSLQAKPPRFQSRDAIERDETFNKEKAS